MTTYIRAFGALLLSLTALGAQPLPVVHINGSSVYDGNGGPFVSGKVYHIISNGAACCMGIPAGKTLTMQPGVIVKIDYAISVRGHLDAKGVVFTSWHDDSVGGDSNNNGATTSPGRGDWLNIELHGTALFEDCRFSYGGSSSQSVFVRNGTMTMRRCTIEHSKTDALLINGRDVIVTDSKFRLCGGLAIDGMSLRYVPQLLDNTATQCDGGDYVRVLDGTLDASTGITTLDRRNSLSGTGVFVFYNTNVAIGINSGGRLVVPKGTTFKFERGIVWIHNDLIMQGTAAEPVVFTSIKDDSFAGDTNKDGNASTPARADWRGIHFRSGAGASRIINSVVRYGGGAGSEDAGIMIHGASVEVRDSVIDFNEGAGAYFRGGYNGTFPLFVGCTISNNSTEAGRNMPWQSLALCSDNTASGNLGGDYFVVAPERPTLKVEIGPENYPGDVLVVNNGTLLSGGGELDIRAGTIIKFTGTNQNGFNVSLNGALRVHGTAAQPVVMTSIHDDSVGGDTNVNGNATTPQAGQWKSLWIGDNRVSSPSLLEHVVLRYAGYGNSSVIHCGNSKLRIRSARIEHVLGRGVEVHTLGADLTNLVIWDAALSGIKLHNGNSDVVHATIVGCGGIGIEKTSTVYAGAVRSSIVWNNTGGNFGGAMTASDVYNSNGGFAGANGNIMQMPLFANAMTGDFHLSASSPCLGRGDLVTALGVKSDHDEHSRILDPTFSGVALPDMGAFERWAYRLKVTGQPMIGATMTFAVEGPAGLSTAYLGFLDGGFFLPPFGVELAGATLFFLTGTAVPVGQSMSLSLPNDQSLVGLKFGVQGLGLSAAHVLRGGFTNLYRGRVN